MAFGAHLETEQLFGSVCGGGRGAGSAAVNGIENGGAGGNGDDNAMRERTRLHHDLVPFDELPHAEVLKDSEPMLKMLELIREFDGLSIYRM